VELNSVPTGETDSQLVQNWYAPRLQTQLTQQFQSTLPKLQNVLMGLGHTESRVTTNLLTLIFDDFSKWVHTPQHKDIGETS